MNKIISIALGFVLGVFLISLVMALPVMWLWDWLMPQIFGLKEITWLQAWGLSLLCGLLFKSHSSK